MSRGHRIAGSNTRATDTHAQVAAKRRVAERRRCPACERKAALSTPARTEGPDFSVTERRCRFCGQVVAFIREMQAGTGAWRYRTEYRPPLPAPTHTDGKP